MNPNAVFSASLVTSLVLWFPSMQACLRGDLDLSAAGLRYLAALLVSRLALGGIARLVTAYRATADPEPPVDSDTGPSPHPANGHRPPAGVHNDPSAPPHRRRDDQPTAGRGAADPDPADLAA
ncbi:MAG TPA: hypothetical protein VHL53_20360 [Acidimicrobiia bacterium]|nr:hypothetical protein [Acidimicrobiia bacterium]